MYAKRRGFPDGASGKEHLPMQEMQARSLAQEDLLKEGMAPTPIFLPGESNGQRSLVGYSPQGCKEPDMTEAA